MPVLVTGGAGYIGSHMALELLDAGENVIVIDDLSSGFASAVSAGATFIRGDAGDPALVLRLIAEHAISSIVHFAAKIVVPESVSDPLGYYLGNTVKSRNLIEAALRGGVRQLIFSSTAAVYGNPTSNPVSEDAPPNPLSPYGRSKLMTEWMLADAAHAHGLRYVSLRYFNVAGADPQGRAGQSTPRATHLIKAAVQAALGERPYLEVFGTDYPTKDGSCLRDYIQVTDLARAHLAALAHLGDGGDSLVLNCGYGSGFSVLEVVEMVKHVSGVDFEVRLAPRRAGDPAAIIAKTGRIRAELGWTPRHDDLREIVSQALAWERKLIDQRAA
ncbi:MAG: UDP-glucose 4-epimerase GalE [Hyphomicrobiales bacterium]|nr:UDP-glucose 4-epimerase GalE [Hyphomicrobiales bacterium]